MLGPDPRPPSNDREDEALLSDEGSLLREDVSILADVVAVLKSSWLPALFVGLVSGMVATSFLMSDAEMPRDHGMIHGTPLGWHDAQKHVHTMLSRGLRYIPDEDEQLRLRWLWLTAATTVKMPTGEQIGLGAASILGPNGVKADEASRQLPHFFYESVHYGITGQNPGAAQYTAQDNERANKQLLQDLKKLSPKPTMIFNGVSRNESAGWSEEGFIVQFRFDDLRRQGYQGTVDRNGTLWEPATESILRLGRKYGQWAVYQWFPYQWGVAQTTRRALSTNVDLEPTESAAGPMEEERPSLHTNILQLVLPTRTGFDRIKSSAVVWRIG